MSVSKLKMQISGNHPTTIRKGKSIKYLSGYELYQIGKTAMRFGNK
jgi:hypothetical protein